MNLIELLLRRVKSQPEAVALIQSKEDLSITFGALYEQIKKEAFFLYSQGVRKDTRVALKLPDSIELITLFFSLIYLGAVPALIDNRSCQREFLDYLKKSEARICITRIKGHKITVPALLKQCSSLILLSPAEESEKKENQQEKEPAYIPLFPDKLETPGENFTYHKGKTGIILFSYRGLGYPLPVFLSEKGLLLNLAADAEVSQVKKGMKVAHILPTSHIFALTSSVLCPLLAGAAVVIVNNAMPGRILHAFETYKIDYLVGVPTIVKVLIKTWEKKQYDLSSCKKAIIGGDRLEQALFDRWKEITGDCLLMQGYGLTETCPVLCNAPGSYKTLSLGKKMRGVKTKILSPEGTRVNKGTAGRLFVTSPFIMDGYCENCKETASLLYEGWFDTGDIVYEDKDGFFFMVKRDKNIAKIGGSTVDCTEVQNFASSCPGIKKAALFLEPDPLWSEKMVLEIIPDSPGTFSAPQVKEKVLEYLRDNLATYKIPKEIRILNN